MDGFTLSYIVHETADKLVGGRVDRVMQPSRDMIIITVRNGGENHKLLISANASFARLQLTKQSFENPPVPPMFCMLLRKHLQGSRIAGVNQYKGDRICHIAFECTNELGDREIKSLIIEMMGKYSNLVLLNKDNVILDAIHHVNRDMSRVRVLLPGVEYISPPSQGKVIPSAETLDELENRFNDFDGTVSKMLMNSVVGLSPVSAKEICYRLTGDINTESEEIKKELLAKSIVEFFSNLENIKDVQILNDDMENTIDFFPFPYNQFDKTQFVKQNSLSEAMDAFFTRRDLRVKMNQMSSTLHKLISVQLSRSNKKIVKLNDTLNESKNTQQYKMYGELITGALYNLNQDERGKSFIVLPNYYEEDYADIKIPLNEKLTIKENAQKYFKKYRKNKVAKVIAQEQLDIAMQEQMFLEGALIDLENCKTTAEMNEIRFSMLEMGYIRKKKNAKNNKNKHVTESTPIKTESPDGITILVGKNSIQNDRITGKARANETWLHVQKMPGSHVIIKKEGEIPQSTLIYAAKLAAYFCKGRKSPSITIDYTQKKHIKKPAGSPAGFVIYHQYKSIFISLNDEERKEFKKL